QRSRKSRADNHGQRTSRWRPSFGEDEMTREPAFLLIAVLAARQFATLAEVVSRVDSIGLTVSDMDHSVDFYSRVLDFNKISDKEVTGADYEHLEGVFGARARIVKMKLGDESIELTEYVAPKGRPFPVDSRSNDRWFQHMAIIVSEMNAAYERL